MAMEPTLKVALGTAAFGIFWVLAVFPAVPFLPIGRTAGSLLGAMLMVLFGVMSADEAYAAVDLPILGLLFGTMVVSVYLERADMFKHLGKLLSWRSQGGKDLLVRTCVVAALASALFTNDTCCVVLTEFILKIARQNNLPPKPFLLALASSANIGSAATPIGNPQNLVIAVQSGISFGQFVFGILPATLVGAVVNAAILLCLYWRHLSDEKCVEVVAPVPTDVVEEEDVTSHRFSPATMSHLRSSHHQPGSSLSPDCEVYEPVKPVTVSSNGDSNNKADAAVFVGIYQRRGGAAGVRANGVAAKEEQPFRWVEEKEEAMEQWKSTVWKTCVYVITLSMLVALLFGLNMSWSAITAALALIVLDFKDARPCLEKVSYPLLPNKISSFAACPPDFRCCCSSFLSCWISIPKPRTHRKERSSSRKKKKKKKKKKMSNNKVYTLEEVAKHNSKDDCWLIIGGKVYNVSKFLEDHPGGDDVLLSSTGKDATDDFEDVGHSTTARAMMDEYYVGDIDTSTIPARTKYVPPKQPHYNQDKTPEFIIKILQFLVPIAILALAVAIRIYTKSESA